MTDTEKHLAAATDAAAYSELKDAHNRVLRLLDKKNKSNEELVGAIYRAAKDAAAGLRVPALPTPKVDKRKKDPEILVCVLADWQLGKTTPTYNSEIAAQRIKLYAEKVLHLLELQRSHHPVREARIYLLGDLIEGELIFPGQEHRIDASLYSQIFNGAEILAGLVRTIASAVEKVKVVAVIGNHGALGGPVRKSYHPETNGDAMLYNVARMLVKDEKRVEWAETFVANERAWYATDYLFGKKTFLWHGDQIKGGAFGYPWYGLGKKLLGYATSIEPGIEYSFAGHFHVPVRVQLNNITHWGAGSPESSNTWAAELLASGGQDPSQWALFVASEGVSAEYLVRLGSGRP